jgi:UDP-N-acetylglucosamine 2-epimerase (non-hydrolysing)
MERPEAIESGPMIMTGLNPRNVVQSIGLAASSNSESGIPKGYGSVDFSDKVLKYLCSTCTLFREWKALR